MKRLSILLLGSVLSFAALAQNASVNLTWTASTDNKGVTGYNVYRDNAKIGTSTTTSYTDSTANATTQYSYTVTAVDAAGNESGKSIPAVVAPPPQADTTPPSVPTNLTASVATQPSGSVEVPGPNAASFAKPYYTCMRNFYIATNGNDANSVTQAQNQATPWLTIGNYEAKVGVSAAGGDCVNVTPGLYSVNQISVTHGGSSSAANGYVVYRSTTLGGAVVKSTCAPGSSCASIFMIGNSTQTRYVMIDGFELDGNKNGSLVCVNIQFLGTTSNHHIWVTNNNIHDCSQSGISTFDGDWFWFLHNNVHDNSSSSGFAGSGISVYEPHAQAGYTPTAFDNAWSPHHIVINYNYSHDNQVDASNPTDGNGIILDDWSNHFGTSGTNANVQYTVPGLVYGNLLIHNGSKGFAAVYGTATGTVVANNTSYNNSWSTVNTGQPRGEFSDGYNYGLNYRNNIAYATSVAGTALANTCAWNQPPPFNNVPYLIYGVKEAPGAGSTAVGPFVAGTFTSNVAFGNGGANWATTGCMDAGPPAASFSCSTNKCNADPMFVGSNNFALKAGSPAIGYISSFTLPSAVTPIPDAGACNHTLASCP